MRLFLCLLLSVLVQSRIQDLNNAAETKEPDVHILISEEDSVETGRQFVTRKTGSCDSISSIQSDCNFCAKYKYGKVGSSRYGQDCVYVQSRGKCYARSTAISYGYVSGSCANNGGQGSQGWDTPMAQQTSSGSGARAGKSSGSFTVNDKIKIVASSYAANKNRDGQVELKPSSSASSGDLMLMFLGISDTNPPNPPSGSGFVEIVEAGNNDLSLRVFSKRYSGSDKDKKWTIRAGRNLFASLITVRGVGSIKATKQARNMYGNDGNGQTGLPSLATAKGGVLFTAVMYDDPHVGTWKGARKMLTSFANGDDGQAIGIYKTNGQSTGILKSKGAGYVSGGREYWTVGISYNPQ